MQFAPAQRRTTLRQSLGHSREQAADARRNRPAAGLPRFLQAKLAVGPVDDPLEHEADATAERVMRMPLHPPDPRAAQPTHGAIARSGGPDRDNEVVTPQAAAAKSPSNIDATLGLKPVAREDEWVMGRTAGEFVGDVGRPIGSFFSNVYGSAVGALTGVSISSTTTAGPVWYANHGFNWRVGFATTGRNGWLVQEIDFGSWRARDAAGNAVPGPPHPHFFEAWGVDAAGAVTPNNGPVNDIWNVPALAAVEGHWDTTSNVYFTTVDPATQGFIAHNPATSAVDLLSSPNAPAALNLGTARMHRHAQGHWDATTPHTGMAGP